MPPAGGPTTAAKKYAFKPNKFSTHSVVNENLTQAAAEQNIPQIHRVSVPTTQRAGRNKK
jgi:hypothetical protein